MQRNHSMSDSSHDVHASRRLTQRFVAWSFAIASSLPTTGMVALRPSPAWSQEDTDAPAQKVENKSDQPTPQDVQRLIQEQQFDQAATIIDAALAEQPTNPRWMSLDSQLNIYLLRLQPEQGVARMRRQIESVLNSEELTARDAARVSTMLRYLASYPNPMPADEKLQLVDQAIAKVQPALFGGSFLPDLVEIKGRLLLQAGRAEEAKQVLDQLVEESQQAAQSGQPQDVSSFVRAVTNYASLLGDTYPEESKQLQEEAEGLVRQLLASDNPQPSAFALLLNLKMPSISRSLYTAPREADAELKDLEELLASLKEKLGEDDASLRNYERSLSSYRSRLEAALKREELIGTMAPEIEADAFVGQEPVTMADLKGKVVLLDFWAVWCGPCIATFPHLIEWHDKYADKGLVILGATRYYGYVWDDETNRAVRGDGEVDRQAELAMLERFRQEHGLRHGFFVTPRDSDYSQKFYVTGIPQAVLIDKEGKIQMIRVGSGEANAHALEEKIQELLGL
ncbi:MAG: hypothetical protein D6753_01505 [Planctomycetota bacterium]|nr:MAG: hypothetical protein D6753_01505 [Planctomycetota bacterium]